MTKVYACLLGEWVCLDDDPNCTISEWHKTPHAWWEENAPIYFPQIRDIELDHSFYGCDYMHIFYKGKDYRINPIFIQIVSG